MTDIFVPSRTPLEVLTGHRVTGFTYELLDRSGGVVDVLTGAQDGGSLTWTANQAVKGRGSMPYIFDRQQVPWESCRIRVSVTVESASGDGEVTWGLGVWVPSIPKWTDRELGSFATINLLSREALLERVRKPYGYGLAAGTPIVAAIRDLIIDAGESPGALTDSDAVLAADRAWPPGTSVLSIINDLATAGGYFSLYSDEVGQYRLSPAIRPSARARAWDFIGARAIYRRDVERELDLSSVPNVFIAIQQAAGEEPALVAVARNDDPEDPLSTVNRGEVSLEPETVDAASQEVLDAYASRRLAALRNATARVVVEHALVPLRVNDTARFPVRDRATGVDEIKLHTVFQTTATLHPTALAKTTLQEVVIDG